jgi:tRNA A-37 threonylcarbamoyl transferase component Bud32
MPDLVGQTLLNRYRIEELIGRGGMAEVYKAWDTHRQYYVAIKVMREDLAEDLEFLRRFKREARALAALSHANVVRFYSFEREGRLAFIVMDYVEGTTLRGRILDAEGTPLPLDEVASVMQQVCAALHYAHTENVLHRDIKPGNIMMQPDPLTGTGGRVLVADFGIAKAADAATATTVMPGTPAYMSPEQCRSELLDARTDVYSLGVVAYEMLTGRRPFMGETTEAGTGSTRERIRWEQMHAAPPPLRRYNPALPRAVEGMVLKALAKEREGRWPTPLAFWRAFEEAVAAKAAAEPKAKEATPPSVAPMPEPVAVAKEAPPVPGPRPEPGSAPSIAPAEREAPASAPPALRVPGWVWVVGVVALVGVVIALGAGGVASPPPTATPRPSTTISVPTPTPITNATATLARPSKLYIEYILDASTGMLEPLEDGILKREAACEYLIDHMLALSTETHIGLRAYGHRVPWQRQESCQDVELIVPVGVGQMETIAEWLDDFEAQGMAPLSAAVEMALEDFATDDPDRLNRIVVITTGQDNCGGDLCALAKAAKARGINLVFHIIGQPVDDATRAQLSCVADRGGRVYYDVPQED